jgi:hypothetical protein
VAGEGIRDQDASRVDWICIERLHACWLTSAVSQVVNLEQGTQATCAVRAE